MYQLSTDELMFFDKQPGALPIYEAFAGKLLSLYPETKLKVQKSQISFSNRHIYACVSFAKVKKKAELPEAWFVLTLGLPYPLESERVAIKTEPYSDRWTTHLLISSIDNLDDTLFSWVKQAYDFSQCK